MAGRPEKYTVSYFPHYTKDGKTMFILENKYGATGYAFWFKLLELLCNSNGIYYDCRDNNSLEYLSATLKVTSEQAIELLDTLSDLEKIDKELWENRIIWCQPLVDNLSDIFKRRKTDIPEKPLNLINVSNNSINVSNNSINVNKKPINAPQSKLNKSKLNNIINIVEQVVSYLNEKSEKSYKSTTKKTQDFIKARINEGFTLDDFKKVIDIKTEKWKSDPKMNEYLRPETLFGTKFESYLNEKKIEPDLQSDLYNQAFKCFKGFSGGYCQTNYEPGDPKCVICKENKYKWRSNT